jgi:hypothetical protein
MYAERSEQPGIIAKRNILHDAIRVTEFQSVNAFVQPEPALIIYCLNDTAVPPVEIGQRDS